MARFYKGLSTGRTVRKPAPGPTPVAQESPHGKSPPVGPGNPVRGSPLRCRRNYSPANRLALCLYKSHRPVSQYAIAMTSQTLKSDRVVG